MVKIRGSHSVESSRQSAVFLTHRPILGAGQHEECIGNVANFSCLLSRLRTLCSQASSQTSRRSVYIETVLVFTTQNWYSYHQ
jgi:hypothetical protein